MRRLSCIVILLILIISVASPAYIHAQESISASQSTEIQFPDRLTFILNAESNTYINRIFLSYKVNKIETAEVISVVLPDFSPALEINVSWNWEMKRMLGSLPPGSEVQYSWRIQNASGVEFATDWNTVTFNDHRHSWDSITEGDISLYWYEGDLSFAQELMDTAYESVDRLAINTGAHLERAIKIYIYDGSSDLRDAILYAQEWIGGMAFNEFGIVAVGVEAGNLAWGKTTIAHEIAHLVNHQMTYNPYSDIPTWLDEGLAMYAQGQLPLEFNSALQRAVTEDKLISVQTISSNFPADYNQAALSYAESYSIVEFLINEYGTGKMLGLLNLFKQGSSYDDALLKTYGVDTSGLDDIWRFSNGLQPRTSPASTELTPTPAPEKGFFSCDSASGDTSYSSHILMGIAFLLVIPGLAVIIRPGVRKKC